ncbi:MAG: hypothetical protein WCD79_10015, partial [Chthoniobacteraceae bacterium]
GNTVSFSDIKINHLSKLDFELFFSMANRIQEVVTEPRLASYASNLLNMDTSLPDPFANGRPIRIDGVGVHLDFVIGPVHRSYRVPYFNDHLDAPGPGYRERKPQPSIRDWNIPPKSQA